MPFQSSFDKKIFLISTVKNEEDVIESFIRYHANIMDGMIILDNGSTDRTTVILNELVQEGIPLYLLHDTSIEHAQSQRMTKLLYYALDQFNPDFIFPLDSDEFIYTSSGQNPREIIKKLNQEKVYYLKNITYVPDDNDNNEDLFVPRRIGHCVKEEWGYFHKILVPKNPIIKHSLSIKTGNHDVTEGNKKNGSALKEVSSELKLAHYPIRSVEQILSKILVGWVNNLSRSDRHNGEAEHWHRFYEKIKLDKNFIHRNFKQVVYEYVFGKADYSIQLPYEPLDLSFCENIELRYTNSNSVNHYKNLLENCEKLALQYAELKKQILQFQEKE